MFNNFKVTTVRIMYLVSYINKMFSVSSGSSPGQDGRSTQLAWTTSCKNWASTTPGLRFPNGYRGAWWTRWTKCCRCSLRSWAPPCRTRRRRKAETKRSTEEHSYHCNQSCAEFPYRSQTLDYCITMATTVQHIRQTYTHFTCNSLWNSA